MGLNLLTIVKISLLYFCTKIKILIFIHLEEIFINVEYFSFKEYYEFYDGFVVLHGTDTMSYTASALSFMLEALGKVIVITGSQLPIFDSRSDGLDNFLSSLVIAANYNIPEVCIFFGTRLLRGNRTSKLSTQAFDAFNSLNYPPLAVTGIRVEGILILFFNFNL